MDFIIPLLYQLYSSTLAPSERAETQARLDHALATQFTPSTLVMACVDILDQYDPAAYLSPTPGAIPRQPEFSPVVFFCASTIERCAKAASWSSEEQTPLNVRERARGSLLRWAAAPQAGPVYRKAAEALIVTARRDWPRQWPDMVDHAVATALMPVAANVPMATALLHSLCDGSLTNFTPGSREESLTRARRLELQESINRCVPMLSEALLRCLQRAQERANGADVDRLLLSFRAFMEWAPIEKCLPDAIEFVFVLAESRASAVRALMPLVDRAVVPAEMENFVLNTFRRALRFVQAACSPESPSDYQVAVIEFVAEFLKRNVVRVERRSKADFDMTEFLAASFNLTFAMRDVAGFLTALRMWSEFVVHVDTVEEWLSSGSAGNASTTVPQGRYYVECLTSLALGLVKRFLFAESPNRAMLEQLEASSELVDEHSDGEDEDEEEDESRRGFASGGGSRRHTDDLDLIVSRVVALTRKIADLPFQQFSDVQPVAEQAYVGLEKCLVLVVSPNMSGTKAASEAARDASTHLAIVSAVAPLLSRDISLWGPAKQLLSWSMGSAKYGLEQRLWGRGPAYIKMLARSFDAIRAFSHYSDQQVKLAQQGNNAENNVALIQECVDVTFDTLAASTVPESVVQAGIGAMASFPIPLVVSRESWPWVVANGLEATLGTSVTSESTRDALYSTFAKIAFHSLFAQNPEAVALDKFTTLFGGEALLRGPLVSNLMTSSTAMSQAHSRQIIVGELERTKKSLRAATSLVRSTSHTPETEYKNVVFRCVGPLLTEPRDGVCGLLEWCAGRIAVPTPSDPGVNSEIVKASHVARECLDLTRLCLALLRKQIGDELVATIASFVVSTFGTPRHRAAVVLNAPGGEAVVCRVLELLDAIVSEPTAGRAQSRDVEGELIPGIINLVVLEGLGKGSPNSEPCGQRVVQSVLISRWNWFTVQAAPANSGLSGPRSRVLRHDAASAWRACLDRSVARLDLTSELDHCRQGVADLLQLDKTHRLFEFPPFREIYVPLILERVRVIIQSRERQLLNEDLANLAYRLVKIDPSSFSNAFSSADVLDENKFKEDFVAWAEA